MAFAASIALFIPLSLFAAAKDSGESGPNPLQASAIASQSWLNLLDKGNYAGSWDQASSIMKHTIPKEEWQHILEKVRKPLGHMNSRQVLDQRTAKNPQGLPPGDYMVMFYKTSFEKKAMAYELVTLYLEDGEWRVLTYQVD